VDKYLWLFNGHEVLVFLEHGCRRGMSRGEKGTAYLDGLLLSIVVSCSIFSSCHFMKKMKWTLNGWLLLKNEEGKEGQGSSIGDHKVYSIDGQQVTVLSPTGVNQM
jgi:hypothetical protein